MLRLASSYLLLIICIGSINGEEELCDYHDRTCDSDGCFLNVVQAFGDCTLTNDNESCDGENCKFIGNSNIQMCVNPTELSQQTEDEIITRIKSSSISVGSQQLCLYDDSDNVYDILCKKLGGIECDPVSKKCVMTFERYSKIDSILEPLKKDLAAYDYNYDDHMNNLLIVVDGTSTKAQFEANGYDAIKNGEYSMSKLARWKNGNWANHPSNFYEDYRGVKYYWYGPDNSGKILSAAQEIRDIVEGTTNVICDFIRNYTQHTNNNNYNIDLIGYSRGGYTVMETARKLHRDGCPMHDDIKTDNINIRFMGLYDPVSSVVDITTNGIRLSMMDNIEDTGLYSTDSYIYHPDSMPTNVDHIVISYGDPRLGSRAYFNTCQHPMDREKENIDFGYYITTHSGVGGDPMNGDYDNVKDSIQGKGWKSLWGLRNLMAKTWGDVEIVSGYNDKMECVESMKADLHIRSFANQYGLPIDATTSDYYKFDRCPGTFW